MEVTITVTINKESKVFDNIRDVEKYIKKKKIEELATKIIRQVKDNTKIQHFLVKWGYKLPLGYFSVTSYKGITATVSYEEELCYQHTKKYPDLEEEYQDILKLFKKHTITRFFYAVLNKDSEGLIPCRVMYLGNFDKDFSDFEVETIDYEE